MKTTTIEILAALRRIATEISILKKDASLAYAVEHDLQRAVEYLETAQNTIKTQKG